MNKEKKQLLEIIWDKIDSKTWGKIILIAVLAKIGCNSIDHSNSEERERHSHSRHKKQRRKNILIQ